MDEELIEQPRSSAPREEDERPLTAEFDILEAELDREPEPTEESENPRDTLSDEELDHHVADLNSVVIARERARVTEDP